MKMIMRVLICLMLGTLCYADAQVLNPGFESMSGDPLLPDNWTTYKGTGATVYFAAKTDIVYDGTYSFKIAARQGYGLIYQKITSGFTAGETYSFWIYGRGDTSGDWAIDEPLDRIELSAKFEDAGGGTISEPKKVVFDGDPETEAPILVASEWLQSPILTFTVPDGTASIVLKISSVDSSVDGNLGDGTSIYIDDVTLAVLPLPAQNPTPAMDATEQDASELYLTWEPGDDPYNAGTPNPDATGYYLYVDKYAAADAGDPNFLDVTPISLAGTQYPAAAPGLALGYDQVVFWRVDTSINGSSAADPNTVTGEVWSFTTESSYPVIVTQPQDVTVFEGEPAAVSVEATGVTPIALYEWYDSNDLPVASGPTLDTLTFPATVIEDSDSYYCVITNEQGKSIQSDPAVLYVQGVLAQYDFENDLTDSVGPFDGTAKNIDPNETGVVAYDTGISGSALVLDSGNYVELAPGAYPNSYMGLANGTLVCWVKTTSAVTETVIGAYNDGFTTCYNLSVQVPERLYFSIRTETNNIMQIQVAAPGITDGNWHQIAATYALGQNAAVYMDGEQLATAGGLAVSAEFAPWMHSLPIGAGDTRGTVNNAYTGSIDSLILYNYPKTDKEILDLYNASAAVEKSLCLDAYASTFDLAGPDGVGAEFADCRVDLYDFAAMAATWLDCGLYPACSQ